MTGSPIQGVLSEVPGWPLKDPLRDPFRDSKTSQNLSPPIPVCRVLEGHYPRGTPFARLSEEICLSEGSAGVSQRAPRGLSEGSAGGFCGVSAGLSEVFRG